MAAGIGGGRACSIHGQHAVALSRTQSHSVQRVRQAMNASWRRCNSCSGAGIGEHVARVLK